MKKSIIIVGMGPGLSLGIAHKFGSEGYKIGMTSRSAEKLAAYSDELNNARIENFYVAADAGDEQALKAALRHLVEKLGTVDVLVYNAVDGRMKNIMEETVDDLAYGFKISVANALTAVRELLPELKKNQGAAILTGGITATHPNPNMAAISLGKAGIRNLALQLNQTLKPEGVYAGTITIGNWIQPESATHSPAILAEKFWELNEKRNVAEVRY